MQAVVETGGKQYIVTKGDKLAIEKLAGNPGDEVTFDKILLVDGETPQIGTPYVDGAKVVGKILKQEKAKKITVYKYKRRKGYHKKQGHRQQLTRVEIKEIQT